jgi:hypothetical protein
MLVYDMAVNRIEQSLTITVFNTLLSKVQVLNNKQERVKNIIDTYKYIIDFTLPNYINLDDDTIFYTDDHNEKYKLVIREGTLKVAYKQDWNDEDEDVIVTEDFKIELLKPMLARLPKFMEKLIMHIDELIKQYDAVLEPYEA